MAITFPTALRSLLGGNKNPFLFLLRFPLREQLCRYESIQKEKKVFCSVCFFISIFAVNLLHYSFRGFHALFEMDFICASFHQIYVCTLLSLLLTSLYNGNRGTMDLMKINYRHLLCCNYLIDKVVKNKHLKTSWKG